VDQKNTWLIKICCVIAAFSLWLYIINETNTQTDLTVLVPVEVTNVEAVNEKGFAILPGQQFTVNLKVKATTADALSNKSQFKVVADMSTYAVTAGENRIPLRIDRQPPNVNVLNSEAYYVKIELDELIKKTFPVKANLTGKVKDGYYAFSSSITPTEVEVSGAAKYVSQVATVEAKSDYKGTDKDLNMKLSLRALDSAGKEIKEVTIRPDTAEVIVPVKKTKSVGIKVETKGNLPKGFNLKALVPTPEKIDIAGDESINNISTLSTEPIDLSTLTPNKVVVVKIIKPNGVSLLDSDGTVMVKAILDNVIEKSFQVSIQLKNVNEAYNATLDNNKFTVVVSGIESAVNALKNDDFSYTIDAGSLTAEGEYPINITSVKVPDGVTKVSHTPQSVKVTLKKKETQQTNTPANGGQ
jgi:YbbR domain-containing protein